MSNQEAGENIVRYWEQTVRENYGRANWLEELALNLHDKTYADLMRFLAQMLREQATRLREWTEQQRKGTLQMPVPGSLSKDRETAIESLDARGHSEEFAEADCPISATAPRQLGSR